MYDLIIVGGNLSGASAAINATKNGVNVLLIEKNKEPVFPPRCGEATDSITAEILNLNEIGCPNNEISNITFNVTSKNNFKFKAKKHRFVIIDRNFLEKHLLKIAKESGAELFLGRKVIDFNPPNEIILDNGKTHSGKILIDASGIRCQLGKKVGINPELKPKDIGVCIQSRVQCDINPNNLKMWFHHPYAPMGYAWFFPKNEKLANIGLGVPGNLKLDFEKMLKMYIEKEINGDYKILHTFRSCVPSAKPLEKLVKDNVMFVGDAARLTNAIFENGINLAVFSGTVAGIVAAEYIKGNIPNLDYYEKLIENKKNRLIKTYITKSRLTTEDKFEKSLNRVFKLLFFANKIFPNLLQNQLIKVVKKDKKIIDYLKYKY